MTENKGYDPFSDDEVVEAGEAHTPVAKDDPMDELMTPSGVVPVVDLSTGDDGWAPIKDEPWKLPEPVQDLESMIQHAPGEVDRTIAMPTRPESSFDLPAQRNPLPDADPVTESDRVWADRSSAVRSAVRRAQPAPDSNEAILQSGTSSSVKEVPRNALPSQADAPPPPAADLLEPRPMAWALPGLVFVSGVAAGIYVLVGLNPILGGIAIALSVVGSLFLRVFLKQ